MNGMTDRKPFEETVRTQRLTETAINGRTVVKGMDVSLTKRPGRPSGRYEVHQVEREASGKIVLTVYGPRGRGQSRWHYVNPDSVRTVHRSAARAAEATA